MSEAKQDFKKLLEDHLINYPKIGDILKGTVISIDPKEIRIDIKNFTTAIVRGRELFQESKEYSNLKIGDEVEATVIDLENENGEMELSFRIAGMQRVWDNLKKWMSEGLTMKAKVLSANKGGLIMQLNAIQGFMPVSQLSPDNYPRVSGGDKNRIFEKLLELVSKELEVKIIDVDEKEEKLIVSEKSVWEDSQKAILEAYKVGDIVSGEISAITSFGVFVKFGEGLEGLIHISEIAWQRIDHPKDILKIGMNVEAQVIQMDHSKIYLSMKRLVDDPWKKVKDKYKLDEVVKGKILKVEPFGLMVSLDDDIHGLAHISELSDEAIGNINEKFKVGEEKNFIIVSLEPAEHRLGLRLEGVKGKLGRKEEEKTEKKTDKKAKKTEKTEKEVKEKLSEKKSKEKPEEKKEEKEEEKEILEEKTEKKTE